MQIISQKGRSMVEMLGVLAIVGVLSVGAIAGYSKAMMKYKLNKQAESFNLLLNNLLIWKPHLEKSFRGYGTFDFDTFTKLNIIPDGMKIDQQNKALKDVFNNTIRYYLGYHNNGGTFENYFYVLLSSEGNSIKKETSEICHNILNVAKDNAANIHNVQTRTGLESSYSSYILYGDRSNNQNPDKRLRNMTLNDVENLCYACVSEKYCQFFFYIDVVNGLPKVTD